MCRSVHISCCPSILANVQLCARYLTFACFGSNVFLCFSVITFVLCICASCRQTSEQKWMSCSSFVQHGHKPLSPPHKIPPPPSPLLLSPPPPAHIIKDTNYISITLFMYTYITWMSNSHTVILVKNAHCRL